MNRRRFLQHTALASAALLAMPSVALAKKADPVYQAFQKALKQSPMLAGWKTAQDMPRQTLQVTGKVPAELRGTLFRNGPALFDRADQRVRHWFAGDGMVQAWRIGDESVTHEARFVRTKKFTQEQEAGRFLYGGFGMNVTDGYAVKNNDSLNTANINVLPVDDELWALWEAGSPIAMNPETLATHGRKTFRDDLASIPFLAHPQVDAQGHIWNLAPLNFFNQNKLGVWHLDAKGGLKRFEAVDLPFAGYLHSFATTQRYLIAIIAPWMWGSQAAQNGMPKWTPKLGSHALIIDKASMKVIKQHSLPAGMAYHWADAWENATPKGKQSIGVRGCWVDSIESLDADMAALMRGHTQMNNTSAALVSIDLPLGQGEPTLTRHNAGDLEFPSFHNPTNTRPGHLFTLRENQGALGGYLNSVQCINGDHASIDQFNYGNHCLVEEHLFVPKKNAKHDRDGWLIGTRLDAKAQKNKLAIFQADQLADGPIAEATLPTTMPMTFHGVFVS